MMNSIRSNIKLEKYKLLGSFILIGAVVFVISDIIEWYIGKDEVVLGFSQMPMYRRFLTDLYVILWGYGGYLLIRENSKSWYLIIISMSSFIPSFLIIPIVWNVFYYTNWIESLPFLLWYLLSAAFIVAFIIKRKDFGINNWMGRFSLILLINIIIRILHELIIFNITKA